MTHISAGADTGMEPAEGPRVFISYAHESDGGTHAEGVRALWILLREHGIDARLDRPAAEQPQDWAAWMQREFEAADYVLTIASPAYKRRAEGTEEPGTGEGVAWEARLIKNYVYVDLATWYKRILRVVLPGGSREDLPAFLGGHTVTHYTVDPIDSTGAEKLLRYLTDQPYETVPPLGLRPDLPPRRDTTTAGEGGRATAGNALTGPTVVVRDTDWVNALMAFGDMSKADFRQALLSDMGRELGLSHAFMAAELPMARDHVREIVRRMNDYRDPPAARRALRAALEFARPDDAALERLARLV
ncbi:hypothetical protein C6Y14_15380 [Streptomyces dioscori]|uniref:SEFIR domain-containing protein n=1 Tax=Streptomyces dioscori TaxID=2109333 RepID=A0A2P8Q8L7_9ACTN|nr:TIR domain-containing protein [Streptomyces dioscori]PSM42578.1 hypothetical protein C6Y14_15380 [Streptomyces dioscori]